MGNPSAFVGSEVADSKTDVVVSIEIKQRLGNFPKEDKEPVKLLVIGSKQAVQAIVQALHMCGFAEILSGLILCLRLLLSGPCSASLGS